MQENFQNPTLVVIPLRPDLPPRVSSAQLLRGQRTVSIAHGDRNYTLRVTQDNKLILTK
jgi:hemin uptake protein HemP